MSLLAPLGLLALAALALPVLIHLLRRSEQKDVEFAALRWLGTHIRPRERLQLHRRLLLVLRLLLLATLAILLARPALPVHGEAGARRVLIWPGVDMAAAHKAIGVPLVDAQWLAPGFPPLTAPPPSQAGAAASLLREADAETPRDTALTIVVPAVLEGLDAERLQLAHAVDWKIVAGAGAPSRKTLPRPSLHVALHEGTPAHEDEARVVRALVQAWRATGRDVVLDEAVDAKRQDTSLWFWLGGEADAATREWIASGGRALVTTVPAADPADAVVLADESGSPLLRERVVGRGRLYTVPTALTPQTLPALLDPHFPQRLIDQLDPREVSPSAARADAVTPQPLAAPPRGPMRPLDVWFVLLAAALFVAERGLATRPRVTA